MCGLRGRRASEAVPSAIPWWAPPRCPGESARQPGRLRRPSAKAPRRGRSRSIPALVSPGHHRTGRDHRPGTTPGTGGYPRAVNLQIDGLHKTFGTVVALDGLTFDVPGGEIFG